MLLDAGLAPEGTARNHRRVVIVVAGEVGDCHLGIGKCLADQAFYLGRGHGHWGARQFVGGSSSAPMKRGNQASCAARSAPTSRSPLPATSSLSPPACPSKAAGILAIAASRSSRSAPAAGTARTYRPWSSPKKKPTGSAAAQSMRAPVAPAIA